MSNKKELNSLAISRVHRRGNGDVLLPRTVCQLMKRRQSYRRNSRQGPFSAVCQDEAEPCLIVRHVRSSPREFQDPSAGRSLNTVEREDDWVDGSSSRYQSQSMESRSRVRYSWQYIFQSRWIPSPAPRIWASKTSSGATRSVL